MDVALICKLLDRTPIEDLRKYLEVYNSDTEAIQGMSGSEMLWYMAARPRQPFSEEYAEALKIREYNLKPGNLTGFNCPVCRNKGHLMDISEDGYLVTRMCECQTKRAVITSADRSNMGDLLKNETPDFRARLVSVLARLDTEEWRLLEKMALKLVDEMKKEEAGQ